MIEGYVKEGGHLTSCAADLRQYVSSLDEPAAAWLAVQLQQWVDSVLADSGAKGAGSGDNVRRRVCAVRVAANMGHPKLATPAAAERHMNALMILYADSQNLYQVRGVWGEGWRWE